MKRLICVATFCVSGGLMSAGCANVSTDPHTGGLIGGINGITTGSYDRRLADKQADVADLEAAGDALQNRIGSARERLANLDRKLSERKSAIGKMKADIAEIDKLIAVGRSGMAAQQGTLGSVQSDNSRKEALLRPLQIERDTLENMVRDLEQTQIIEAQNYRRLKSYGPDGGSSPGAAETQMADLEKRIQDFGIKQAEATRRLDQAKKSAAEIANAG